MNVSRLVKLLQSYSDAQEEDTSNVKASLKGLHTRIDDIVERLYSMESGGVQRKRSYSPKARQTTSVDNRQQNELELRLLQLEDRLNSAVFKGAMGRNPSQKSVHQASSSSLQVKTENLNEFAIEVDRALKDMEERLLQIIAQKSEETRYDSRQLETHLQDLNRKVQNYQSSTHSTASFIQERQKIAEAAVNGMQSRKLETALNEWLERVEEQVNLIDQKTEQKA